MAAVENTLIIIKPDLLPKKNNILQLLHLNGFRITHRKTICCSPEQAAEFYKEFEKTDSFFAIKVMALSRGPSEAIILNKSNAVNDLLTLLVSPSFSHYFWNSESGDRIHASASKANAVKEIKYIFPNVIVEPSRKIYFGSYCGKNNLTGLLAEGILHACQSEIENPRGFLSDWLFKPGDELQLNKC